MRVNVFVRVYACPAMTWSLIQVVFPPYTQNSWNMPWTHCHSDQKKSLTESPWILNLFLNLCFKWQGFCVKQGKTEELQKGPEPPFFKDSQLISLLPAVPVDKTPTNTSFGEVLEQVNPSYKVVSQTDSGYSNYLYRLHESDYIFNAELILCLCREK